MAEIQPIYVVIGSAYVGKSAIMDYLAVKADSLGRKIITVSESEIDAVVSRANAAGVPVLKSDLVTLIQQADQPKSDMDELIRQIIADAEKSLIKHYPVIISSRPTRPIDAVMPRRKKGQGRKF